MSAALAAESEHVLQTKATLADLYKRDARPWVVAFSGGKDSTLLLQLVYDLLVELGAQASKTVHVVSSDTRVEAPNVSAYLSRTLKFIEEAAAGSALPLEVHLVKPEPHEGFWAKLIGAGYPSPTRWFRWCTTNIKIRPSRRVIEGITRQYGSVILLLGTRVDESSDRGKRMQARQITADGLNPHHEIPNALVATPIVDWSTEQVWEYLYTHNPPPWGGSHDFLLDLYRRAAGGECPVVFDLSTPSCGGSRFGCWTCTVVKEDKSMQGFIQSGETGFAPLNDFRDHLKKSVNSPIGATRAKKTVRRAPGHSGRKTGTVVAGIAGTGEAGRRTAHIGRRNMRHSGCLDGRIRSGWNGIDTRRGIREANGNDGKPGTSTAGTTGAGRISGRNRAGAGPGGSVTQSCFQELSGFDGLRKQGSVSA